jgi:hypothetical protein
MRRFATRQVVVWLIGPEEFRTLQAHACPCNRFGTFSGVSIKASDFSANLYVLDGSGSAIQALREAAGLPVGALQAPTGCVSEAGPMPVSRRVPSSVSSHQIIWPSRANAPIAREPTIFCDNCGYKTSKCICPDHDQVADQITAGSHGSVA